MLTDMIVLRAALGTSRPDLGRCAGFSCAVARFMRLLRRGSA
jgi:hypothetical protein